MHACAHLCLCVRMCVCMCVQVMVETVVPEQLPHEFSLAADIPQVAFRKLRQEWVDMGYAVDPSKTTGPHGSLNM